MDCRLPCRAVTPHNRAQIIPFAVYRAVRAHSGAATPERIAETTGLPLSEVERVLRDKRWPHSRAEAHGAADLRELDFA